jgi:hypothetical protein
VTGRPVTWVYDNGTTYTGGYLDDTPFDEALALRQLDDVERALGLGVRIDVVLLSAFWFDPDGGYREWDRRGWPQGPDRWLARCAEVGVRPGLWIGTNALWKLNPASEWASSIDPLSPADGIGHLSMSDGPFFPALIETLEHLYDRGIRLFEFDAADLGAGSAAQRAALPDHEIRERNIVAFTDAVAALRERHPDLGIGAFGHFGGETGSTTATGPFAESVDPRIWAVLDGLSTGDPRIGDIPHSSTWRAMDIHVDAATRRFAANGVPLDRIDPFGFVMSPTWIGARRGRSAFRSMGVLLAARTPGRRKLYGDLGLMTDEDARWLARVQEIYTPVLENGTTATFGGSRPDQPYGFESGDGSDRLITVVNPAQEAATVGLPVRGSSTRLLFADSGFVPVVDRESVVLGAGQLAVIGTGRFATAEYDLGVEPDVVIPHTSSGS